MPCDEPEELESNKAANSCGLTSGVKSDISVFGGRDNMSNPFLVFPNNLISTSTQSVNAILREVKSEHH
jgi:hypothetical protein